jgi:hypothetical protein
LLVSAVNDVFSRNGNFTEATADIELIILSEKPFSNTYFQIISGNKMMIKPLRKNITLFTGSAVAIVICCCCSMALFLHYLAIAAPLKGVYTLPTNNTANMKSSYEVLFTTATTGTIKTINIAFPNHTNTQFANLIEREGIGPGSLLSSSDPYHYNSTIKYTVDSPVSIPDDTFIKLKISNITNTDLIGDSYTSLITTKDSTGNTIDGPTKSFTFVIMR